VEQNAILDELNDDHATNGAEPMSLPPLNISGVVLTKAQLIDALGVYIPTITDFTMLPDGVHFAIFFSGNAKEA